MTSSLHAATRKDNAGPKKKGKEREGKKRQKEQGKICKGFQLTRQIFPLAGQKKAEKLNKKKKKLLGIEKLK